MLIPILNNESTHQELSNVCWLLNERKASCKDSNLKWKIVQLASKVDELYENFLEEDGFWPLHVSEPLTEPYVNISIHKALVIQSQGFYFKHIDHSLIKM